jgi:hypothetical protein
MFFILFSICLGLFLFLLLVVGVWMLYKVSEEQRKVSQALLDYTTNMGQLSEKKLQTEIEFLESAKFSNIQREIREVELQKAQLDHLNKFKIQ